MRYIKLFESYNNYAEYSRMKNNLEDMFVELEDDDLSVTVHNAKYTQENLDKMKEQNPYGYKKSMFYVVKEPSMVLNISIYNKVIDIDESGEDVRSLFSYKDSYNDNIEMANEYVKGIYNLTDQDIVYRVNSGVGNRDLIVDGGKYMSIEICYIIKGDTL